MSISTWCTGLKVDPPGPGREWSGRTVSVCTLDRGIELLACELEQVGAVATTAPVVNQINLNPFSYRKKLIEAGRRRDLVMEAYSPLGTGRHLSNPRVRAIARRIEKTPSQVLIRWGLQHDFVVLAKSTI